MDWIKLLNSFWVGGLFCALAQILIDKTNLTPARIMVSYVVAGVVLKNTLKAAVLKDVTVKAV